jgi:predicted amidophosphoribosyltransferase
MSACDASHGVATRVLRSVARSLDALVPCGCAGCGVAVPEPLPPLCGLCRSRLRAIPRPLCDRCGFTRLLRLGDAATCSECVGWPAHLRRAASPFLHQGIAAECVRGLKYRGWTALAPFMGRCMADDARRLAEARPAALVPVPLAASRRRERGFNQAELLAEALAATTGWPVVRLLVRPTGGPALARVGRRERSRLAARSYIVTDTSRREAAAPPLRDRALLVDDVITTGATAGACAAALERSGIHCLGAVSFARTAASL